MAQTRLQWAWASVSADWQESSSISEARRGLRRAPLASAAGRQAHNAGAVAGHIVPPVPCEGVQQQPAPFGVERAAACDAQVGGRVHIEWETYVDVEADMPGACGPAAAVDSLAARSLVHNRAEGADNAASAGKAPPASERAQPAVASGAVASGADRPGFDRLRSAGSYLASTAQPLASDLLESY